MSSADWAALAQRFGALGLEQVRVGWCDLHGVLRGKTLVICADAESAQAAVAALQAGIGMVGTMLLKDSSERTVVKVFEPAALAAMPGLARFAGAANVTLRVDPATLVALPWAPGTGWLRATAVADDGAPLGIDSREALRRALAALADSGHGLVCGLEVEFHVHRLEGDALDVDAIGWPGAAPTVRHTHAGYRLLSEEHADANDEVLAVVRRTALGLGLPLRSLEIELGPSQFEAVFAPLDALAAADALVSFRSGVRQALRRAGYLASFVCRPPLPGSVASGWHLHQSLVDRGARSVMAGARDGNAPGGLSAAGASWLAGLLAHAGALAAVSAPSLDGASRFAGGLMAPQAAVWARENRGAMLRVVGCGAATRIENRLGEPVANPYLVMAAQVWAGLDGLQRGLQAPAAVEAPYADTPAALRLPATLAAALDALDADAVMQRGLGLSLAQLYAAIKRHEIARFEAAEDRAEWSRREYFGRY
jgi:glutamine synthetase